MAERLLDRNYFCLDLKKMIKKEKNWKDFQFLCVYTILSMYTGLWLTFYQDMFQFQIQVPVTTACVALKKFAGYEDKGKRGLLMTVKGHIWYLDQEYILTSMVGIRKCFRHGKPTIFFMLSIKEFSFLIQ